MVKENIFMYIIKSILYIFKCFYIGIKACTIDIFMMLFNLVGYRLDSTYKMAKNRNDLKNIESVNASGYNYSNQNVNKKKEKIYKHSDRTYLKLQKEYNILMEDLQKQGAIRNKEVNCYIYKVMDKNGKIIYGKMNGLSKLDINVYLLSEGYKVFMIKTSPLINFVFKDSNIYSSKMSTKELAFWLTQLSTYLKAGITLNEAVKILGKQMKKMSSSKKRAIEAISYELTLGENFSSSMEKQGNMFPALLINMIKAAEASGKLVETLDEMADYYTEINKTKKAMKSAMTYPTVITVFALVVVFFILTFIIPKFVDIYESSGATISGITLVVINISMFLQNNYMMILLVLAIIFVIIYFLFKRIKIFRKNIQILLMHVPVIKDVIIYNELTIFTKTFASLLRNNVFITDSMNILGKITNNEVYKEIIYKTIDNIKTGNKISDAFKDHFAIPDVAYFMIVTGEDTGELAQMMEKVSDYYSDQHRNIVNTLKSFIEPVMICLLAVIVGVILIAVIVPMFQLYDELLSG